MHYVSWRTRLGAASVLLTAVLLIATACGSVQSDDGDTIQGGTFTIGGPGGISLDPVLASGPIAIFPAYEPLIYQDADGDLIPSLATEWGYVDGSDNTQFSLTIRQGVTFSDGDQLNADAVVGSLQRFLDSPENSNLVYAGPVESIEATGDYQVLITYSEPFPVADLSLSQEYSFGLIVSPTGVANPDVLATETHGTGQYVLDPTETTTGSSYTYLANEDYWTPEAVKFDKVVYTVIDDESARIAALESGEINMSTAVSAVGASNAEAAGLQVLHAQGTTKVLLMVTRDEQDSPLNDARVRQAISLALNRQAITDALSPGVGTATSTSAQVSQLGNTGEDTTQQDISAAKELLAEAGYPDGVTLTLLADATSDPNFSFSTAISDQLEEAGIDIQLIQATGTFDNFINPLYALDGDLAFWGEPDVNSYYNFTASLYPEGIFNVPGTTDAQLEGLLDSAATAADLDAAMQSAVSYYDSLYWMVPIDDVLTSVVYSANVENLWVGTSQVATPNAFSPDPTQSWELTS